MSPRRITVIAAASVCLALSIAAMVQAARDDLFSAKSFPVLGQDAVLWHDKANFRFSAFSRAPVVIHSAPVPASPTMPEHYEDVLSGGWFRANPTYSFSLWLPLVLSLGTTVACLVRRPPGQGRGFPIHTAVRKAT